MFIYVVQNQFYHTPFFRRFEQHIINYIYFKTDVVGNVGMNGMINSDIYPREWTLEVDLSGTNNGGRNANIHCSNEQTCTIKCNANSCESLNLYCETDATCIVEPSDCIGSTTNGQTFDGTICPSFV